jgi:hypothetical protein
MAVLDGGWRDSRSDVVRCVGNAIGGSIMATLYPTDRERREIKRSADAGDKSAADYLKLLDVLTETLENSNGVAAARGLMGEHDDVYGHAVDDALADLVPTILDVAAGGWESLKFYARPEQVPAAEQSSTSDESTEEE